MSHSYLSRKGFSLVETMIGLGVMALVITGGLVALGQANLLSEKNSEQVMADFALRVEVEALRSAPWDTLSRLHNTITAYQDNNQGGGYPELITFDKEALLGLGLAAEVNSAQLNRAGQTGKLAFRILLSWQDRSGKSHNEARVLIITEGGFSAEN